VVRLAQANAVKIERLELRRVTMSLVTPFTTSFGTIDTRDILLVRAIVDGHDGWGECGALSEPIESSEYLAGAVDVIRNVLAPRLWSAAPAHPQLIRPVFAEVKGHRLAKAAVETAVLDAWLRARHEPLAQFLGAERERVAIGVSVGITGTIDELLRQVTTYRSEGYRRIKLKIRPGWDIEPVAAVRRDFGDIALQVDANGAYSLADLPTLRRLDAFELLMIEQPLAAGDLRQHAELAERIRTPLCLDESIDSATSAADAIALGATSVINVKPGRVGGLLEARRVHDVAVAHGLGVWCGGMLETGLGRAANLAFAGLPGCTLPADISASDRYYAQDLTEPLVMVDGEMAVPTGPGVGVVPLDGVLRRCTTWSQWLKPPGRRGFARLSASPSSPEC
jgi:O-succinylbenzoate synthase